MSNLTSYTYSAASGTSVYGGKSSAWYDNAASGSYIALPNSTFSTSGAGWTGTAPGGSSNFTAVVTPWCGGVLVKKGVWSSDVFYSGTHLVIWGGGHGDYAGNELYAYGPIDSASPMWRRITDPTIPAPVDVARLNGYPVSRHTYDTLVYSETTNKMYALGCPGYHNQGYVFLTCDVFDFSVNPKSNNPWSTLDTGYPNFTGSGTINSVSCLDSSGKAWILGTGNSTRLASLDISTGTWTTYNKDNPNYASNTKAAYSPSLNLMVTCTSTSVLAQNLSSPNSNIYQPTLSGTHPGESNTALEWNPSGFFYFLGVTGTLHKLTPGANPATDAWVWSSVSISNSANLPAPVANGTYGRFRHVDAHSKIPKGAIVMRRHNSPLYFYKE